MIHRTAFLPGIALVLALLAAESRAWITFTDITESAGIDFVQVNGATGEHLFPESVGSGGAFIDYDRDGWLDIYLVNGGDFQAAGLPNRLYRNNGDGTFSDVTERAGVGDTGFGDGTCVGDFDGDGWDDLYVCNYGANVLYRNNGDGTFSDVTERTGVGEPRWSASAAFLDIDRDGDQDLFVANYVDYVRERDGCPFKGLSVYCGPETFDPVTDTLYRNNGDGTFTDVSAEAGITSAGRGLAVVPGDYDGDGDTDIYVANDMNANFLYQNRGDGTFEEVALLAGVAVAEDATIGNGMGASMGDYDNDGAFDLVVTNFQDQVNTLYHNDRDGFFTDVSYASGTGAVSLRHLAWGVGLVDLDNDGWLDLFIANGHVHDNVEEFDQIGTYAQPKLVFRNQGGTMFENVTAASGEAVNRPESSRGVAFGDFDNDGDMDALVNNVRSRATLLRNDGGNANAWVRVVLTPTQNALGARVRVETPDGVTRTGECRSGGSYASDSDRRLLFGLKASQSATVSVRWLDGSESGSIAVEAGRTVTVEKPPR
ncbi:CRTAC1 family protein [Candidatus Poribacteria bacterium]|nr:CRTAC1 family protein [Candidatus Poribacteria bacterium]